MIAVVTCEWDTTANRVIEELDANGARFVRLNTEYFPQDIDLTIRLDDDQFLATLDVGDGRVLNSHDVGAIYYRRPERPRIDTVVTDEPARRFAQRESWAALQGFLRLCPARWLSHPQDIAEAQHKPRQLAMAKRLGWQLPSTLISNDPTEARRFVENSKGDVVAKTIRSPVVSLDPPSFVYTSRLTDTDLARLDSIRLSPAILQERVDKAEDIRVTVVGDRVFAASVKSTDLTLGRDDWRLAGPDEPGFGPTELPRAVADLCVRTCSALRLRFAALDILLTQTGEYVFLECNPNGEWGWIAEMTDLPIAEAVAALLQELDRNDSPAC